MSKSIAWYAESYTKNFGFALVPIKENSKLPRLNDWGNHTIADPQAAKDYYTQNPTHNIGLELGASKMCSLDIDCAESFAVILEEYGIPPETLDDCPTIVGNPKGRRVMFRLPEGFDLPYCKLNWPNENDPDGSKHRQMMKDAKAAKEAGDTETEATIREQAKDFAKYTVFELRTSAGSQRYDMLPPSMHPETGKPYKWTVQPRQDWPTMPPWLLSIWQAWDKFKPQCVDACPWQPEAKATAIPKQAKRQERTNQGTGAADVIAAYCDAHPLHGELLRYGYELRGKRYLSPHSSTGLAGVLMFDDNRTCWVHHASDPLCSEENGQPVNAFDLFRCYDHDDSLPEAVKAAAKILGIETVRPTTAAAQSIAAKPTATVTKLPVEHAPPKPKPVAAPFRALGFQGANYYYLPRGTEQVSEISRGRHTSAADMMSLAPLEWWEMAYPKKNGGCDWQAAASHCMRSCEGAGIYSQDRERGRGAWFDKGRSVLHLGGRLLVDGQGVDIVDHDSEYIYTKQASLEVGIAQKEATNEQAAAIGAIIKGLQWDKPIHGLMAAGWVTLAPICGALQWRPHLWLTAQRGAGKSWALDNIFSPMVGRCGLIVQGSTSEAGIRQTLQQDARPIIFDEAESENQRGASRMKGVIELARQASTDSSAQIIKGGASGSSQAFRARSMTLLGSVNVALTQAADESRFSVVSLKTPSKNASEAERFDKFAELTANTITEAATEAIRARTYALIPVIRDNAKMLARAIAEKLGSQRIGDQVGTLLAGAYTLESRERLTLISALNYIKDMDFEDAKQAEAVQDERSCYDLILQTQVRVDMEMGSKTFTIAEVIECARYGANIPSIGIDGANAALGRYGLKVDQSYLLVSNSHIGIKKMLFNSPWESGWRTVLMRLEGASAHKSAVRFAGVPSKAVKVKLDPPEVLADIETGEMVV